MSKQNLKNYCILDRIGNNIEKSNVKNESIGSIQNIVNFSKNILNSNDTINNIEIYFEKAICQIEDNPRKNLVGCGFINS